VPGFKGKYWLSIFVVNSEGLMLGEYEACIVLSCVVPALLFAWPPELLEGEPEEPPHDAASITISPRIVPSSEIRFMTFSTFLRESCFAAPLLRHVDQFAPRT
jgi:hypothetical protein